MAYSCRVVHWARRTQSDDFSGALDFVSVVR